MKGKSRKKSNKILMYVVLSWLLISFLGFLILQFRAQNPEDSIAYIFSSDGTGKMYGIRTPVGVSYFDSVTTNSDSLVDVIYDKPLVFVVLNENGNTVVESHNLETFKKYTFDLSGMTFKKVISNGPYGAVLAETSSGETWVLRGTSSFGPDFGKIIDIRSFDNDRLFLEIQSDEGTKIFLESNPVESPFFITSSMKKVGDSFAFIVGSDKTNLSVSYQNKLFTESDANILQLFDSDSSLIYLVQESSGDYVLVKHNIFNLLGVYPLLGSEKRIDLGTSFDLADDMCAVGSSFYYRDCEQMSGCALYKNGELMDAEGSVTSMKCTDDYLFYTVENNGVSQIYYNGGKRFKEDDAEGVEYII